MKKPRVFFAIPCDESFRPQRNIIIEVTNKLGIIADIAEDDVLTIPLWEKITSAISSCDLFMADTSAMKPNVILELGYALRDLPEHRCGIFCSNAVSKPADLHGFVRQQYSSLTDFRSVLVTWLNASLPLKEVYEGNSSVQPSVVFTEDFMDSDSFLRRWSTPPFCSYQLTSEGLRFGNANLPLSSKPLALLRDYMFSFQGRILSQKLGWVILLSSNQETGLPRFCVMFNLDERGVLTPHILNWNCTGHHPTGYMSYNQLETNFNLLNGWFTVDTKITGNRIQVTLNDSEVFSEDFGAPPFGEAFNNFEQKEGQIGFRCHPGERGLVRHVVVKDIS